MNPSPHPNDPEPFSVRGWTRAHPVLAILLVLGVLLLAGAVPGYRALKKWRASNLVESAQKAIDKKNWSEAGSKAVAAYQLDPSNASAARILAQLRTGANLEDALDSWKYLLTLPEATAQDRRQATATALHFGRIALAQEWLEGLLQNDSTDADNLLLAAQFFLQTDNSTKALEFARQAHALYPERSDVAFVLSRLLLGSPAPKDRAEGTALLWPLTLQNDGIGLDACLTLNSLPSLTKAELDRLSNTLKHHPYAKLEHLLLGESLRIRAHPEEKEAVLDEVLKAHPQPDAETKLMIARWMTSLKAFERVLVYLPRNEARQRPDLFITYLDAMAALGRWTELEKLLTEPSLPLERPVQAIYQARTASELKKESEASLFWSKALAACERSESALRYFAYYAEMMGRTDQAKKALQRLATNPLTARAALTSLIQIAEKEEATSDLRNWMNMMRKINPKDPAPQNDWAYLNLLLNQNLSESKETAQKLVEADPSLLAFRVTLALAHLRAKEPAKALPLLEESKVDWNTIRGSWQAVYCATLAANGRTEEAHALAQKIQRSDLRPEERLLISEI